MKLKFGLDDIMTTQEAAEDSVRNNIDIDLSRVNHDQKTMVMVMTHELGHLLLHRIETITLAREDGDIPPYKDPEWQANAFAGELLGLYEYIKDMSIIDIASHYGITEKAASIQRRNPLINVRGIKLVMYIC